MSEFEELRAHKAAMEARIANHQGSRRDAEPKKSNI